MIAVLGHDQVVVNMYNAESITLVSVFGVNKRKGVCVMGNGGGDE